MASCFQPPILEMMKHTPTQIPPNQNGKMARSQGKRGFGFMDGGLSLPAKTGG
jgi:hypothetical protein